MKTFIYTFLIGIVMILNALTAKEILQKTINYHDPNGEWKTLKATLEFVEKQPNGDERKTLFKLNNASNSHYIKRGDEEAYQVNSKYEVDVLMGDKDAERGKMLRSYYVYLWGLPMKLLDDKANIETAKSETIKGVDCHALQMVYEKETWTYFFAKKNYRMIAYRFVKNDGSGKGENIYLEGEVKVGTMRIPKARSWYTIPENTFLGTNVLMRGTLTK